MNFNVRIKVLGHTFNIKNVKADNEFAAELEVRRMVERNLKIEHVHPAKKKVDPTVQQLMDIFGMKP
jgi:hypothetical protein